MDLASQRKYFSGRATGVLVVLTLVNLLNYFDRYIVSALVETLKHSEFQLSDAQAGLLMTGFIVVYTIISPYFGHLGDTRSRPKTLAVGILLWSIATALGGFAAGFVTLFLSRALVGVGEAAYVTIAPALLADYFGPSTRSRVFAVFFSAIPIGSALGYMIGGLVDQKYGWRAAFFVAGAPGLLLAVLASRLADPPRGLQEEGATDEKPRESTRKLYAELLRHKAYLLTSLGYAAYAFGLGGLAFWLPAYLERVQLMTKAQAAVQSGAVVVVTGFVGTFVGGWLADWLRRFTPRSHLWLCAGSTLIAAPCLLLAFLSRDHAFFWTFLVLGELALFASTGPVNSAVVSLLAPTSRATGLAVCNFITHVLGDVPSPAMIGWVSDRSSLALGIYLVPASILVGGFIWTLAAMTPAKTYE